MGIRTLMKRELTEILKAHIQWVESEGDKGKRADLREVDLQDVDLRGALLWDADLHGSDLRGANLAGAELQGADLTEANLQEAFAQGANFQGARLAGANASNAIFFEADLQEADLAGVSLDESNLSGANLQEAYLPGVSASDALFVDADLQQINLTGANLENSNLTRASLQEANLHGANFRKALLVHASLQGADLSTAYLDGANLDRALDLDSAVVRHTNLVGVTGLLGTEFAGRDVTGTMFPSELAEFKGLNQVAELSKHARTVFLAVITGCVYSWLTIASTSDAGLLTNSAAKALPIIQTEIGIAGFFWAAPVILLALYLYLHIYLQRMWESLSILPAIFPDGQPLDQRAYPWLLSGLVRTHVPLLTGTKPHFSGLQASLCIVAAWLLVPFTILLFWVRYLPRHEVMGASVQFVLLVISAWSGFIFYRRARETLQGRAPESTRSWLRWRSEPVMTLCVILCSVALGSTISYIITRADLRLDVIVMRNFADLREADVSKKPESWTGKGAEIDLIKGADLERAHLARANAARAFLVKADLWKANLEGAILLEADLRHTDLRYANLRGANLRFAKLRGANLQSARLQGANLTGADLREALLGPATKDDPAAILQDADLDGADLRNAELRGVSFTDAQLGEVKLEGASLAGADLSGARFEGTDLSRVHDLQQSQLDGACGDSETKLLEGQEISICGDLGEGLVE